MVHKSLAKSLCTWYNVQRILRMNNARCCDQTMCAKTDEVHWRNSLRIKGT